RAVHHGNPRHPRRRARRRDVPADLQDGPGHLTITLRLRAPAPHGRPRGRQACGTDTVRLSIVELFELWPPALPIAAAVIGLLVGSFLNVVAHRLPLMMERAWREQCAELAAEANVTLPPGPPGAEVDGRPISLTWPPSSCPSCGARIAPHHNVPVLSYLWLRGRCAHCGGRISPRYPIVEAVTAALTAVVAIVFGPSWQFVAAAGFTWALLALALIDLDHQLLPDSITLPLLWAGLLVNVLPVDGAPLFADVSSAVIGAAAGYLSLWLVFHLFKLLTGKEGMGYGD